MKTELPWKKSDNPHELTRDEIREEFLNMCRNAIRYWSTVDVDPPKEYSEVEWRVSGVVHSVLAAIDGCSLAVPSFSLVPDPHPDDKKYAIQNDLDWYPQNHVEHQVNISGGLHELLHKGE